MADQRPYVVGRNGVVCERTSGLVLGHIDRETYDDAPAEWVAYNKSARRLGNRRLRRNAARLIWDRREVAI